MAELSSTMSNLFEPPSTETIRIPIETVSVRVIPERLQFPDSGDPVLAEDSFRLVIVLRVNARVVAEHVLADVEEARPGGVLSLADPDGDLPIIALQTGERLTVECGVTVAVDRGGARRSLRFRDTLAGHPSEWIGTHPPARRQPWRLWYRIERANDGD
jgi:hypothetical protein